MNLKNIKKIHCIAIGGIGVSALAKLFHKQDVIVTGSDVSQSDITDDLQNNYQIMVTIGSNPSIITDEIDLIIYSPAVPETDDEFQYAKKLGIPLMSYPEVLGKISLEKTTIAITGTNGKTTTTSMLTESLKHININPTVIIGGVLQKYNSNFLSGDSEYFITEACEYKRSFLNIHHNILVITNITLDHLDYFSHLTDIQSTFIALLNNKKGKGILVCNPQLENLKPVVEKALEYGMAIIDYGKYLDNESYQVSLPGAHNRENMAATLGVVEALHKNINKASEYLKYDFQGVKRRLEHIGETQSGALLYDDYAHNPEGIHLLIKALRSKYEKKKIVMLFEPHLYSRTQDFAAEFGKVLSESDILYLFPVYKSREPHQPHKDFLLEPFITMDPENFYMIRETNIFKELFESKKYNSDYIIVTVGAGNIWQHGISIKK